MDGKAVQSKLTDFRSYYLVTDPRYKEPFQYREVTPYEAARVHLKSLYLAGDLQTRHEMTEPTVVSVQKQGSETVLKYKIYVRLREEFEVEVSEEECAEQEEKGEKDVQDCPVSCGPGDR